MQDHSPQTSRRTRTTLHAVFALTGFVHAIGGPLLPSLNRTFHLTDSEAGLLFLVYFGGSSIGALFCRGNYTRAMTAGFAGTGFFALGISAASRPLLLPMYFLLGICVGVAMSAVSLFAGRNFPNSSAPLLTILNFSWSAGALTAPMLAAQILRHHGYRVAYLCIAFACLMSAFACRRLLADAKEVPRSQAAASPFSNLRLVALFSLLAFLQVGVENTASVWLTTYMLRVGDTNIVKSAASSSLFWFGFLASRAFSAVVLLRTQLDLLLRYSIIVALCAALLLIVSHQFIVTSGAMLLLGIALAPIYPLVVAASIIGLSRTSDTRFVLAAAGIGGSILPWMTGWISALTQDIRLAMTTVPTCLVLMMFCLRSTRKSLDGSGCEERGGKLLT